MADVLLQFSSVLLNHFFSEEFSAHMTKLVSSRIFFGAWVLGMFDPHPPYSNVLSPPG